MFGKSIVGEDMSLGQVHIELDTLDLDDGEPCRKVLPLADLVSTLLHFHYSISISAFSFNQSKQFSDLHHPLNFTIIPHLHFSQDFYPA